MWGATGKVTCVVLKLCFGSTSTIGHPGGTRPAAGTLHTAIDRTSPGESRSAAVRSGLIIVADAPGHFDQLASDTSVVTACR
jgi:hypothetical protein